MAQRVEYDGTIHEFPDDFSTDDIQKALSSLNPATSGNQGSFKGSQGLVKPEVREARKDAFNKLESALLPAEGAAVAGPLGGAGVLGSSLAGGLGAGGASLAMGSDPATAAKTGAETTMGGAALGGLGKLLPFLGVVKNAAVQDKVVEKAPKTVQWLMELLNTVKGAKADLPVNPETVNNALQTNTPMPPGPQQIMEALGLGPKPAPTRTPIWKNGSAVVKNGIMMDEQGKPLMKLGTEPLTINTTKPPQKTFDPLSNYQAENATMQNKAKASGKTVNQQIQTNPAIEEKMKALVQLLGLDQK